MFGRKKKKGYEEKVAEALFIVVKQALEAVAAAGMRNEGAEQSGDVDWEAVVKEMRLNARTALKFVNNIKEDGGKQKNAQQDDKARKSKKGKEEKQ